MSPWFLSASVVGLALTANAFWPVRGVFRGPAFFASWLVAEMPIQGLLGHVVFGAWLVSHGEASGATGVTALVLTALSAAGASFLWYRGAQAEHAMQRALGGHAAGPPWPRSPLRHQLFPFAPFRTGVRRIRNVEFARHGNQRLCLDVYLPPRDGKLRPAILQIHGGAWVIGDKREQGLPLLYHLAENGFVGFNANYRLSPRATFPDPLVDVKRAIAWIREHAAEYGADPNFICITGGSAGGHLSALAALTPNAPEYQPGFEDADTRVQAAVPLYGVFCFKDRLGIQPREFLFLLERLVMKERLARAPERFSAASPLDRVNEDAPPFLVVHGDRDTLAPPEYARLFVQELRRVSRAPVLHAELRGAQHAFDVFTSPRTVRVIEGIERFLTGAHRKHLEEKPARPAAAE